MVDKSIVAMDTLTIVKKGREGEVPWKYELLETGEEFSSIYEDATQAFYDYISGKRLAEFCNSLPAELTDFNNLFDDPVLHDDNNVHHSLPQDIFEGYPLDIPDGFDLAVWPDETESDRAQQLDRILKEEYFDALQKEFKKVREENCDGCLVDHPSQRRHDCLMMDPEIAVELFYDTTLNRVDEEYILNQFYERTGRELTPPANELELLQYKYNEGLKASDYFEIKEMLIRNISN